jgi:hypothetical protein
LKYESVNFYNFKTKIIPIDTGNRAYVDKNDFNKDYYEDNKCLKLEKVDKEQLNSVIEFILKAIYSSDDI